MPKRFYELNFAKTVPLRQETSFCGVMTNWLFESCPVAFTASLSKPACVDLFAELILNFKLFFKVLYFSFEVLLFYV